MPDYLPAFLDLRGRRVLVVGGGVVGERKARELLECGAVLTIVSPVVSDGVRALAETGAVRWRPRAFRRADTRGCALVVAATGDVRVDDAVAAAARRTRALVNVVDRPAHCDFVFGSVLRRGALQIAVSTGGRSPALAREIRRWLEGVIGPEYAELLERVALERQRARASAPDAAARVAAGERVVATLFTPVPR